ncbi:MAG: calcium:sodium antiporter, partial [Planctomycetota bacterium]
MEYIVASASLLGGFVLLAFAGDYLVAAAANLAVRLKVSPLFIGITVVAAGTSLPELIVCLIAQFQDSPGLVIGNIFGSNIFNIGLVLGSVLVLKKVGAISIGKMEVSVLIISTLSLLIYLFSQQNDEGYSVLTQPVAVVMETVFLFMIFLIYRSGKSKTAVLEEIDEMITEAGSLTVALSLALGTFGLWLGGKLLVDGAITLASLLGIQETIIGLTIVAAGTGAPELFASLAALRRGSSAIAVGNVVGSNLFNTIGVLGAAALVKPISIRIPDVEVDMIIMFLMT